MLGRGTSSSNRDCVPVQHREDSSARSALGAGRRRPLAVPVALSPVSRASSRPVREARGPRHPHGAPGQARAAHGPPSIRAGHPERAGLSALRVTGRAVSVYRKLAQLLATPCPVHYSFIERVLRGKQINSGGLPLLVSPRSLVSCRDAAARTEVMELCLPWCSSGMICSANLLLFPAGDLCPPRSAEQISLRCRRQAHLHLCGEEAAGCTQMLS